MVCGCGWLDCGGAGMRARGTAEWSEWTLYNRREGLLAFCLQLELVNWSRSHSGFQRRCECAVHLTRLDLAYAFVIVNGFPVIYIQYSMPRTRTWVKREDIRLLLQLELAIRGHVGIVIPPRFKALGTKWEGARPSASNTVTDAPFSRRYVLAVRFERSNGK